MINKGYRYGKIPTPNFKRWFCFNYHYKTWLKDMNDYRVKQRQYLMLKSMILT